MKQKYFVFGLLVLILAFLFLTINGYYRTEFNKKPVVKEKIQEGDIQYLYDFYISATPNIEDRLSLGTDDARVSMIIYIDFSSDVSKNFIDNVYPEIESQFINTGKVKFYHKNFITMDDYLEKNERFIYAKSLFCVKKLAPDKYFDYYFRLFDVNSDEAFGLAIEAGIDGENFKDCIESGSDEEIIEDLSEVENFGISLNPRMYIGVEGQDNTIIDGVASFRRMQRIIRNYETYMGE